MKPDKIVKIALFNLGLLLVNVILFSKAFVGLAILGGSAIVSAAGMAVVATSFVLFGYVNYQFLTSKPKKIDAKKAMEKLDSLESCSTVLKDLGGFGVFAKWIDEILEQIRQMQRKQELVKNILLQKFNPGEMSFQKFKAITDSTEAVLVANIKSIINKISAFDEEEYQSIRSGRSRLRLGIADKKMEIYTQYIRYVEEAVGNNDEILLRLDRLVLELSNLNSFDPGELEKMVALQELDALIKDTKWYK